MKKYLLPITVFICGALGMILELVAARILSPYVGSSNLIWTIIIGVMLTSMSLGYWVGGKKADKNPSTNQLSILLLVGAVITSFIPLLETLFVKNLTLISENLVMIAFLAAAVLFGLPSFVLATVSPFAVKLRDKQYENVGEISGSTSSLSTIGSIVGTFLAGFLFIPFFGIRYIILGVTLLLLILSFALFEKKEKKYFAFILAITLICIGIQVLGKITFDKQNPDILQDVDSEYSRIWVKEVKANDTSYKTLQVDTGLESYIEKETGKMGAKYLYYYDLPEYYLKNATSTLMIGGAAYTYPTHYLSKYQDKTIDVVEIDAKMTEIAEEQFGLNRDNNRLHIYHQDGRSFLNTTDNQYDVILIDAFKGENAPFELTTYEAMQHVKDCLNENGMVITNVISSLSGKEADFILYEYSTYQAVFDDVKVFKVHPEAGEETVQNLILVGIKGNKQLDETKYEEYTPLLETEIKDFTSDKGISTDHYAPIGN